MAKTITFNGLSKSSIEQAKKELIKYKQELEQKNALLAKRLAELGLSIAKDIVSGLDAIESGELLESLNIKAGDVIQNRETWYIYTDCPHAKFVEFGTGYVGENNTVSQPAMAQNGYKVNSSGRDENGWWYYDTKQERLRWTAGMPSRPFMYETASAIAGQVQTIAKEIFG